MPSGERSKHVGYRKYPEPGTQIVIALDYWRQTAPNRILETAMIPGILRGLLFLCVATPLVAQNLDILIRNGSVLDGSGSPAQRVDIGIRADRVVLIEKNIRQRAKHVIDARGLIVAPGFIDPHTHTFEDLSSPATSRNDAYLMQGVTTVATGNDGDSPLQIGAALHKWEQQGIGTNAALFIGQGTVRRAIMGMSDATPTPAQIDSMKVLVDQGMKEGAIGMSTGLYYAPGSYSSTEEVIALAKVAAADGGIYDTHMRDESSYTIGLLGSVRETIRIGREAHIPVMISHIKALGKDVWGQSTDVIVLVNAARAEGLNVTASQYPYTASGSSVEAALIPRWAEVGGSVALLQRIDDPAGRGRLIADMQKNLDRRGGPQSLLITAAPDKEFIGKTLGNIAQENHLSPIEAAFTIVKKGGADVASFNMTESDIRNFMRESWVMTCSDGSPGHPRKYGTFPEKLRKYVFEEHAITLPFAIRSNTSLPAETLRLKDRGLLKPGYFADVVVFDPKTIRANSTYQQPRLLATGVRYLLVNGQLAIDAGQLTNAHAGQALPHGHPAVSIAAAP
jgi:N-acyl-D-amino-acid deacylase